MFVTFDGIDGGGKSTYSTRVADILVDRNHKVILTREPGTTVAGEKIREILLHTPDLNSLTMAYLFSASFMQSWHEIIKPHLDDGYIVISDRWYDSTSAYQMAKAKEYEKPIIDDILTNLSLICEPDMTFILAPTFETAWERINKNTSKDTIESSGKTFFQKVYRNYNRLAKENDYRTTKIKPANIEKDCIKIANSICDNI